MIGNNTIILCPAEARRLIDIALRQEGYCHGDFVIKNITVDKNEVTLYIEGKGDNGQT